MNSACETTHYSLITINFFSFPIDEIGKCGQISKPLNWSAETKTNLFCRLLVCPLAKSWVAILNFISGGTWVGSAMCSHRKLGIFNNHLLL
jgi:hypothetical protein